VKDTAFDLDLGFFGVGSLLQAFSPLSATVLLAACMAR
jgi:hypothetical protein